MRKINYFFIFALVGLLSACGSEDTTGSENENPQISEKPVFVAETDIIGNTRTSISTDRRVLWSENDFITIFPKNSIGDKYQLISGAGTQSGSFKFISSGSFSSGSQFAHNVAVYPYSADYLMSKESDKSYNINNIVVPSEQTYVENNISQGALPMVAVTNSNNLKFKNVGGLLKLNIISDKAGVSIKKITLEGRSSKKEVIAGNYVANIGVDGQNPTLVLNSKGSNIITLECNSLNLSNSIPKTFYIAVPTIQFSEGFILNIFDTKSNKMTLRAKPCSINRNQILAMPTITYRDNVIEDITPGGYIPDMPNGD